jgi:glycosyltransferase involved in cell wall biosynthesis
MITIIHPSRWRCEMALTTFHNWMKKADHTQEIQYILSIDTTDNTEPCYQSAFKDSNVTILVNPNRSIVDAVNVALSEVKGDIIVVVSDDFDCPKGWDTSIIERLDTEKSELLHVYDGIQNDVCTLPVVTKRYADLFGFIYHPQYFSMFADNDLTDCSKIIGGYIEAFDLHFQHNHYIKGLNKRDKTYDRENSKQAWDIGKSWYRARKIRNYDIEKR